MLLYSSVLHFLLCYLIYFNAILFNLDLSFCPLLFHLVLFVFNLDLPFFPLFVLLTFVLSFDLPYFICILSYLIMSYVSFYLVWSFESCLVLFLPDFYPVLSRLVMCLILFDPVLPYLISSMYFVSSYFTWFHLMLYCPVFCLISLISSRHVWSGLSLSYFCSSRLTEALKESSLIFVHLFAAYKHSCILASPGYTWSCLWHLPEALLEVDKGRNVPIFIHPLTITPRDDSNQ